MGKPSEPLGTVDRRVRRLLPLRLPPSVAGQRVAAGDRWWRSGQVDRPLGDRRARAGGRRRRRRTWRSRLAGRGLLNRRDLFSRRGLLTGWRGGRRWLHRQRPVAFRQRLDQRRPRRLATQRRHRLAAVETLVAHDSGGLLFLPGHCGRPALSLLRRWPVATRGLRARRRTAPLGSNRSRQRRAAHL